MSLISAGSISLDSAFNTSINPKLCLSFSCVWAFKHVFLLYLNPLMILRVHQRPLKHNSNAGIRNTDIIFINEKFHYSMYCTYVLCKSGPICGSGLTHLFHRTVCTTDNIFKLSRSPGFDSKESIPPSYVAWQASMTTLILLGFFYISHRLL